MRPNSYYDDDLNDVPPPPPWWQGPLVFLAFIIFTFAVVSMCSCTCTLDGESVARAIIVYQSAK